MTRYKIIGFDCSFTDDCWLREKPFGLGLHVCKGKTKAVKFYEGELKEVELALKERGVTWEREGKEEKRPKNVSRK